MTDEDVDDLKLKISILEAMIEDAGAWMMLDGRWPSEWLKYPERRKILSDLNCGPAVVEDGK